MILQLSSELVWKELKQELFAVLGMATAKGEARTVGAGQRIHRLVAEVNHGLSHPEQVKHWAMLARSTHWAQVVTACAARLALPTVALAFLTWR